MLSDVVYIWRNSMVLERRFVRKSLILSGGMLTQVDCCPKSTTYLLCLWVEKAEKKSIVFDMYFYFVNCRWWVFGRKRIFGIYLWKYFYFDCCCSFFCRHLSPSNCDSNDEYETQYGCGKRSWLSSDSFMYAICLSKIRYHSRSFRWNHIASLWFWPC